VKIAVVSYFALTRRALCGLLSAIPGQRVVLDVEDAAAHVEQFYKLRPDALLMDAPCSAETLEVVLQLRKLFPGMILLLLVEKTDPEFERQAVKAGIRGCISKECGPETLAKALTVVEQGQYWMSRGLTSLVLGKLQTRETPQEPESQPLSRREWEILSLISRGHVNKEIASSLSISSNTVKAHLSTIYRKLGVTTRLEAALNYFQQVNAKGAAMRETIPIPAEPMHRLPALSKHSLT
jgi:DNA-binding NarL/FixJ family response regulator